MYSLHSNRCHTYNCGTVMITLGVLLLACGCAIYLLFRSKSLNIYQWCSMMGVSDTIDIFRSKVQDLNVYEFVKYSLPDGLYCAAYILIMDAIWHNDNGIFKCSIIFLVPCVTICSELLQYFELIRGTFDIYDLMCYILPTLVYLLKHKNKCLMV